MELQLRILANKRIGPHPIQILSVIYGTLLGDSHLEKRIDYVRISFQQENSNMEYLMWLWNHFKDYGYCSSVKPTLRIRIGKNGKIRRVCRFHTWTYSSLNFLLDEWYRGESKKRVPLNIEEYLTPLALACWAMDDGAKVGKGFKFSTNSFLKEDIEILSKALLNKYGIITTIQSAGVPDQWVLYIVVSSMPIFREIVKNYMVPSMYYKLGI